MMDMDRLKHSYSVAKKMQEIGRKLNLDERDIYELFVLGLNHDIGYEYSENGKNHNKIGGEILKNSGFKNWKEVYYHGMLTNEYSSLFLDILNCADMQIDKYGNDIGFDKRLEDIKGRYGEDSVVFARCVEMVNYFKTKNFIDDKQKGER